MPVARSSRSRGVPTALIVLAVLACGDGGREAAETARDSVPLHALSGIPVMPGARVLGAEGGPDAVEAAAVVALPPDSVANWYRAALVSGGWQLRGDVPDMRGAVTLHARRPDGRPVWIMIRPGADGGTVLSVIGAVPDPAAQPR
ncbi:MAG: hypothetical protein OER21_11915 [Gemmatimonadota bacterium]|nr:hypothetical protein [Gemmatimonadota bacterium]